MIRVFSVLPKAAAEDLEDALDSPIFQDQFNASDKGNRPHPGPVGPDDQMSGEGASRGWWGGLVQLEIGLPYQNVTFGWDFSMKKPARVNSVQ